MHIISIFNINTFIRRKKLFLSEDIWLFSKDIFFLFDNVIQSSVIMLFTKEKKKKKENLFYQIVLKTQQRKIIRCRLPLELRQISDIWFNFLEKMLFVTVIANHIKKKVCIHLSVTLQNTSNKFPANFLDFRYFLVQESFLYNFVLVIYFYSIWKLFSKCNVELFLLKMKFLLVFFVIL